MQLWSVIFLVVAVLALIAGLALMGIGLADRSSDGGEVFDVVVGAFVVAVVCCCCSGALRDFDAMCDAGGSLILPFIGAC